MKQSLRIFSGWISLCLILAYSTCNAQAGSYAGPPEGQNISQPANEKVVCKARVIFHGQELSGLMMFKQVSPDTVRFAFFNELGMSFVEGSVSVGSGQQAARSNLEIVKIADFLNYRSFRKNMERALNALLWDQKEEKFKLPVIEDESIERTRIYKKGRKFVFRLQWSEY